MDAGHRLTEAGLATHDLQMGPSVGICAATVVVALITGFTLVFLYAAVHPRFGAGPKTAALVGILLWLGGYFLPLLGYAMIGLYPAHLLVLWGAVGLVEMVAASILGAWLYREEGAPASPSSLA